ncbi:MAG: trypsin-like peptidase domain-containing protein [Patescibacteria group bacterium]
MQEKESLNIKVIVPIALISLLAGALGGAATVKFQKNGNDILGNNPTQIVEERHYVEESETINAIQKVAPTVISIVATKDLQTFRQQPFNPFLNDPFFRDFLMPMPQPKQEQEQQAPPTQRQKVAGGTGFLVKSDGLAVTNKHVVADTDADYTAVTKEGKEYDVEIISRDPVNDLAVVQLHEKVEEKAGRKTGEKKDFGPKLKDMPVVELGDSTKLQVGQKVFAIGNARGEYENSVTAGIISAIGREIHASDQGGTSAETLSGLIQTDAAINFGNSGGPLINLGGEVIGINTAIDTEATGIGFAIPANQMKPALASVEKFGRIVRPVLGVTHTILNKDKAQELKLDSLEYGALITGDRAKKEFGVLPGSPAEKAGLKLDDVILEVDGEKVTEKNTLQSMIQKHAPGDKLKLKVWRAGTTFEVTVTLDEKKE